MLANNFFQKWATHFSTTAVPSMSHITSNISSMVKSSCPGLPTAPHPTRRPVPLATVDETATLLSLLKLLRSRSAPLNELLSIARDSEPRIPISLNEYIARHQGEARYQPPSDRRCGPEAPRGSNSNEPDHDYGDFMERMGLGYERGYTPPRWSREEIDIYREPPPADHDEEDEEYEGATYVLPFWYKGGLRWKYSP